MNPITFYQSGVRDNKNIFIGSSDIPVIIKTEGTKVKKSQRELWQEKTGQIEGFKGNESTQWGHDLEPLVLAKHIKNNYGDDIAFEFKKDAIIHENFRPDDYRPPTDFLPYTEAIHPKFPWAVAHGDALFSGGKISQPYLLEGKTGRFFSRIKRDNMEGFNISESTDIEDYNKIPADVMLQVQWQMLCYGVDLTYVLLLVDDNQYFEFKIPAFKKWFPFLLEKASRFYNYCINMEQPPPEKKEDVYDMFSDLKDKAVYVTGDRAIIGYDMRMRKKHLQKLIKKYRSEVDDINDSAVLLMGENKFLYNGETGDKLFSQSVFKKTDLISANSLDPEDKIKYEKNGVITTSTIRKVN